MSAEKVIETGYTPRPLQAHLHRSLKRFNVLVCHRRFGKTVFCINEMLDRALRLDRPSPQYAYIAPNYGQAKRVAWEMLKTYTANIPGVSPNEAELRLDIPRPWLGDKMRFMLLGAENPASIKGIYLDGSILDEYAEMNPSAWREAVRPTLSDRLGWAIFIGTPKGRNSFWELYNGATNGFANEDGSTFQDPEWFSSLYKASETGIIPQSELESARRSMSEEEFEQEFECSFQAGLVGAYFTKEISRAEKEKRITSVPYDPALPTHAWFDLGMNDMAAVWITQQYGAEKRLIHYLEAPDTSIPEWVRAVNDLGYGIDSWNLPHDARARELTTGTSREDLFKTLVGKRKVKIIERVQDKMASIEAARRVFSQCVFDRERCKRGIEALMNYQRKWDAKNNVFSPKPLHNWASNGADAFQQFALGVKEESLVQDNFRPRMAEMDFDPLS